MKLKILTEFSECILHEEFITSETVIPRHNDKLAICSEYTSHKRKIFEVLSVLIDYTDNTIDVFVAKEGWL